ncbi:hypothetical protein [Actinomycetospora sp. NBC_00405]|uniref:hypothetical protein n=1 Tax=Actinomycetospora sp. NBC_00405 TaxID=2975952 RepID=UPI002E23E63E
MTYRATALRMLISCPGDVEDSDLAAVRRAITRWNVLLGEEFEHVVVPVSWSEHAASEFGEPPQDILNRQLVDVVDMGLAIFWGRLGTPTGTAESGTAEEIMHLHAAGKPVSVLRCVKPVPPRGDHEERARLDKYLNEQVRPKALLVEYEDSGALERQVDTILNRLVRRHEKDWEPATPSGGRRGRSHIIPSIDSQHVTEYSSKGQPKSKTKKRLVFTNEGGSEARDITWRLEPAPGGDPSGLPYVGGDEDQTIPVLAAGASTGYPLLGHMGTASQVVCHVDWLDDGNERHNETTLRP